MLELSGKRVLVTGHTGFKGSWLTHLLLSSGCEVAGYSLSTNRGFHYQTSQTSKLLAMEFFGDVRDTKCLSDSVQTFKPDVIVHFAAQALVSISYEDPYTTFSSNVEGTNSLLQVANRAQVAGILIITSDKVYSQNGSRKVKLESDPLGGFDPYSASKAAADIVAQSWMNLSTDSSIHVARGGNVVGGGDRGADRLLPDFERSLAAGSLLRVRNPSAVRPWQHVLDCLTGYMAIVGSMPSIRMGVWNVGPANHAETLLQVSDVLNAYSRVRGRAPNVELVDPLFRETEFLSIDSSLLEKELGWTARIRSREAIEWAAEWERRIEEGAKASEITRMQIEAYQDLTGII